MTMVSISPEIILRSDLNAPFDIQALVIEEDTAMILSADTNIRIYDEHPIRLMTSLLDHKPESPGSIVTRGESPYCFYAIVHDFDQYPSFKEDWVDSTVDLALGKCAEKGIQSLAMQLLGSTYGTKSEAWFLDLLTTHLSDYQVEFPSRILVLD
jgi:hypothetical protein